MSILEFSFTDRYRPWELKRVHFKPALNLLVGVSGAGKTRLLQSLKVVCAAGVGSESSLRECCWSLKVKVGDTTYDWSAETGAQSPSHEVMALDSRDDEDSDDGILEFPTRRSMTFLSEYLSNDAGTLQVSRENGTIKFNQTTLPKLKDTESVISLLQQETDIEPLYHALSRVHKSSAHRMRHAFFDKKAKDRARTRYQKATLQALQEDAALPFLLKASILQDTHPGDFERLVTNPYREIFPSVTGVRVGVISEFFSERERERENDIAAALDFVDIALQEEGVDGWVTSGRMSSGMRRTLLHVLELALSPPGTVLLIDEYENSMGINCLPAVTDQILERSGDLQFIITSHHPYVINNVDKKHWMVVRRRGSIVEVVPASAIPSLDTRSSQDAFIQLMNAEEYRGSIE